MFSRCLPSLHPIVNGSDLAETSAFHKCNRKNWDPKYFFDVNCEYIGMLPIVQTGYTELPCSLSRTRWHRPVFRTCLLILLELVIPAINKPKVIIKMLLLLSFKSAVCGSAGIPVFKSTAVIVLPPTPWWCCPAALCRLPALLPCPGLSQPPPSHWRGAVLQVSCSWLLMLQVQQQFLACALLRAPLFEPIKYQHSQKVRP